MHKIMKRIIYIMSLGALLISTVLTAQEDLERYLVTAAEHNPGLRSAFNEYMAALEMAPQVRALPDPQLAFSYFITPMETRMGPQRFKLEASQMFPWFGTLQAREDEASQNAKSKYEVFLEKRSELFNQVRSTYYDLYFSRRAMDLARDNLRLLGVFHNLARIKIEAGKVSVLDEYRIQMEIGEMENQLALLVDQEHLLEVMFNNLLNAERGQPIVTPGVLWEDDLLWSMEQVQDSIQARNHGLLALSLEQEALAFRKELVQKEGKPAFMLGIEYTVIGKGPDQMAGTDAIMFPMVGISIPLYRNKYRAMVNEVVYLQEAREAEKSEKINMLQTIQERAWKEYRDAGRRIVLFESQRELASRSLTLLETEYTTGSTNFEEILRMERMWLEYGVELEKARTDKQAAISFINYLMGK